MMNVGENRALNGVLDCPESKNEEKFLSIGRKGSSRYAEVGLRVLREYDYSSSSRISSTIRRKFRPNNLHIIILKPSERKERTRDHLYKI
ncbi:hypothetical protein E3N88_44975 [Mikania micrantha]|uniref:Uncharacterized protein n=1 Tax=Mikania micrantha TaxID=192012 RepID=A0A5N6LAJ0_9ASTR|nr:hypothetical protein E3N88_44975 [Mikania micrantha]